MNIPNYMYWILLLIGGIYLLRFVLKRIWDHILKNIWGQIVARIWDHILKNIWNQIGSSFKLFDGHWFNEQFDELILQNKQALRKQLSNISGEIYQVRDQPGYLDKVELLGKLHQNLRLVIKTLAHTAPNQPEIKRLIEGFKHTQLIERNGPHRFASYSVNKGEKIVLCLNKSDNCDSTKTACPLIDLNTLTFVGLHELAHIMTSTVDDHSNNHSNEFWGNYTKLLKTAQDLGLYHVQDYQIIPVEYCGQLIENSPSV